MSRAAPPPDAWWPEPADGHWEEEGPFLTPCCWGKCIWTVPGGEGGALGCSAEKRPGGVGLTSFSIHFDMPTVGA